MSQLKVFEGVRYFSWSDRIWVVAETEEQAEEKLKEETHGPAVTEGDLNFDTASLEGKLETILIRQKKPIDPGLPPQVLLLSWEVAHAPYTPKPVGGFYGYPVSEAEKCVEYEPRSYLFDRWELVPQEEEKKSEFPQLAWVRQALQNRYDEDKEKPLPCTEPVQEVIYLMGVADTLTAQLNLREHESLHLETFIAQMAEERYKGMLVVEEGKNTPKIRFTLEVDGREQVPFLLEIYTRFNLTPEDVDVLEENKSGWNTVSFSISDTDAAALRAYLETQVAQESIHDNWEEEKEEEEITLMPSDITEAQSDLEFLIQRGIISQRSYNALQKALVLIEQTSQKGTEHV